MHVLFSYKGSLPDSGSALWLCLKNDKSLLSPVHQFRRMLPVCPLPWKKARVRHVSSKHVCATLHSWGTIGPAAPVTMYPDRQISSKTLLFSLFLG